ncbi:phosphoribosylamine--glycine ligase [Candidatus Micrarchaeota archaeon]|nr:phosphoribosylamine--glycine ligase [Candidatus Micrarchaeota archaeon]
MNILLVGNGAREHALAQALSKSSNAVFGFLSSPNPGIEAVCRKTVRGNLDDASALTKFAKEVNADFAVFGPEAPLAAGMADALLEVGIPSFGPLKELAKIEWSKSFARELMEKNGMDGLPKFRVFENEDGLDDYINSLGPCVVKADGLASGKGVKVMGEHLKDAGEAVSYARELLSAGGKVVVEEKLEGEEFSLMSVVDGRTVLDCPAVQDHKRALEGDRGANTGGMGSYSCENHSLPFLQEGDLVEAHKITEKVMAALERETGRKFKGVLYGGFMATASGVKLIEYNARFGDPEAMNVLPVMKSDFAQVCKAVVEGRLDEFEGENGKNALEFEKVATVVKYLVPQGYPDAGVKGAEITIDGEKLAASGAKLFYGNVSTKDGKLYTTGSRAIAILGIGKTLEEAGRKAENGVGAVSGNLVHRRDVGTKELIARRMERMGKMRGGSNKL